MNKKKKKAITTFDSTLGKRDMASAFLQFPNRHGLPLLVDDTFQRFPWKQKEKEKSVSRVVPVWMGLNKILYQRIQSCYW
jgi:hypothetical protein